MIPSVKRALAERRAAAFARAAYDEESAKKIPEYLELESKIRALSFELAMQDDAKRQTELDELLRRRNALLLSRNLSLDPLFRCGVCQDTGYVGGAPCACAGELEREELRKRFGCAPSDTGFSECNFDFFGSNASAMEKVYGKLGDFIEKFDETSKYNILLTGSVGSGKTYLATCVYNEVSKHGYSKLWTTAFALGNLCLGVHSSFEQTDALSVILDTDFLVIDDLGTEPIYRNVTLSYFYSILNDRMQRHKKTLVTTNLTQEQILERYGERIFSRLNDKALGVTLSLTGKDLRFK